MFNFDAKDALNGTESKDTKIAKNNLLKKYTETRIAKTDTITKNKDNFICVENDKNSNSSILQKYRLIPSVSPVIVTSNCLFKIYEKEKYVNPLNTFNLILTLISLITISLLSYFFYEKILMSLLGESSFLTFFLVISAMILIRYEVLKLIFEPANQLEIYQHTIFKSISFYAIISIYVLFFFSIYHYRFSTDNNLLMIITLLVLCCVYLSHISIYLKIIRTNPNIIVYLILYLCTFKIAPWLWLYKSIY